MKDQRKEGERKEKSQRERERPRTELLAKRDPNKTKKSKPFE